MDTSLCLSPSSSSTGPPCETGFLLIGPPKLEVLRLGNALGGDLSTENTNEGAFVVEKAPKSPIYAENASEKGSPGALGCILGPEPCPKVMPTLPLVPMASPTLGWDSPRDADGVTKKNSADSQNCGVGPASHPLGEGTGGRPRGSTESFTGCADFTTPDGSPATRREDGSRSRQLLRSFSDCAKNDRKRGQNEQEAEGGGYSTQLTLFQVNATGENEVTNTENAQ